MSAKKEGLDLGLLFVKLTLIVAPILLLFMLTRQVRTVYVCTIPFIIVSCVIWLFIRRRGSNNLQTAYSKKIVLIGTSLFFILLTIIIYILYVNNNIYERPVIYFIIISLMAGIIAVEILYSDPRIRWLILCQTIIFCSVAVFSQILIFPELLGIDPYYHRMIVQGLIEQGSMPHNSQNYEIMSAYHIFLGSGQMITSLNFRFASLLTASVSIILLNIIFIYLLAKYITSDTKIALFSSLILGAVSFHIQGAYLAYPNALALVFSIIVLYLAIGMRNDKGPYVIIMGIMIIAALLMHSIAILFILLLFIILITYSKIFRNIGMRISPISTIISAIIIIVGWSWMGQIDILKGFVGAGTGSGTPPSDGSIGSSPSDGSIGTQPPNLDIDIPEIISAITDPSIMDEFLNYNGLFIFYSLSILGIFVILDLRSKYPYGVPIAIVSVTPFIIGTSLELLGLYGLNERWWYISQILLPIPVSIALCAIFKSIRRPFLKILIPIIVVSLSFSLMTNTFANIDNDSFAPNINTRYTLITSEIQAIYSVSTHSNSICYADDYYAARSRYFSHDISSMANELERANFSAIEGIILIRNEIVSGTFENSKRPIKLNYDLEEKLYDYSFNKIFDGGTVGAFLS